MQALVLPSLENLVVFLPRPQQPPTTRQSTKGNTSRHLVRNRQHPEHATTHETSKINTASLRQVPTNSGSTNAPASTSNAYRVDIEHTLVSMNPVTGRLALPSSSFWHPVRMAWIAWISGTHRAGRGTEQAYVSTTTRQWVVMSRSRDTARRRNLTMT